MMISIRMDDKLKYSLLRDPNDNLNVWTRSEKRSWFLSLLFGTTMLYSSRTTMPLLVPAISSELNWSKTNSGTMLSSFFWGYTLTQVIGGYLSDRFGGQRVIFIAGISWSLITLWMPNILLFSYSTWKHSMMILIIIRILHGAFQGVHFPSMISITSQNLNASERSGFFSLLTSGSALGAILTGTLGSVLLDHFGWQSVFRVIGFIGLIWTLLMRYFAMANSRFKVINVSDPSKLCASQNPITTVPWMKLLCSKAVWACVIAHACQNNCYYLLLSWLPTYFKDNFPSAKGWVVNMIPWLAIPICTLLGKTVIKYLVAKEIELTRIRKIIQSTCFILMNVGLIIICQTKNFYIALICMTLMMCGTGFHNNSVIVNPQDLAPEFSGSLFGFMNTVGSIPGFFGVYLSGQILDLTQSWAAVFSTTAVVNLIGLIVYLLFGSAEPII